MEGHPRTVAIVQARMGSSRLPGKVLMPLAGKPMLGQVLDRLGRARALDAIVVATTDDPRDQPVAEFVSSRGIPCVRGSESDVLGRYLLASEASAAETIIRITADCPLVDPEVVDLVIERFYAAPGCQYASNRGEPRTFPVGLDVEVCTRGALERAGRETVDPACREHVTLYLYEEPGRFPTEWVSTESGFGAYRLTVDSEEDFRMISRIYAAFGDAAFSWKDAVHFLQEHPEIAEINASVKQKPARLR